MQHNRPYDRDEAFFRQTADGLRVTYAERGAEPHPIPGHIYRVTFCCRDQLVGETVTYLGENHHGEQVIQLPSGEQIRGVYDLTEIDTNSSA